MNWLKFLFQKIKIRKSIKAPKENVIKDIGVKIEAIKKLPVEGLKKIKDYAKIENLYKKVQKKSNKRKIKKLDLLLNNNLPKGWNLTKQIIKNIRVPLYKEFNREKTKAIYRWKKLQDKLTYIANRSQSRRFSLERPEWFDWTVNNKLQYLTEDEIINTINEMKKWNSDTGTDTKRNEHIIKRAKKIMHYLSQAYQTGKLSWEKYQHLVIKKIKETATLLGSDNINDIINLYKDDIIGIESFEWD